MDQLPALSDTEFEVLKALWQHGPGTVRQIHEALRPRRKWAYTTVQTLLQRLDSKGYIESDKSGFAHVFRARVSREELLKARLGEIADDLCQGARLPLVLALVEGSKFTPDDIEHFRALIERMDRDNQGKREKG